MIEALDIHVSGIVQGVGFRPFVYRMAKKYLINGWVLNATDGVYIHAEGEGKLLDEFVIELSENPPAASKVTEIELKEVPLEDFTTFEIRFSDTAQVEKTTLVSPDLATCDDCLHELFDPTDRRYRYPFINCTNCGPRFTIIDRLPYDRKNTSMHEFPMCPLCAHEYADPLDRRFHAQPDACFECGPKLWFARSKREIEEDEDSGKEAAGGRLCGQGGVRVKGSFAGGALDELPGQVTSKSVRAEWEDLQDKLAEGANASRCAGFTTDDEVSALPRVPGAWDTEEGQRVPGTDWAAVIPSIVWGNTREQGDAIFAEAVRMLLDGRILAVKGLGGFHLVCDANNPEAVANLRSRKHREGKAFAVMMPTVEDVRDVCLINEVEEQVLSSAQRPIVLLRKRDDYTSTPGLADDLSELGVMLPYTPVQHLLVHDFALAYRRSHDEGANALNEGVPAVGVGESQGAPDVLGCEGRRNEDERRRNEGHRGYTKPPMLVMTSGNIHDEPIVIDDLEAYRRLGGIADAFIGNNRAIRTRFDDSVLRVIEAGSAGSAIQFIRRARGYAPLPLKVEVPKRENRPTEGAERAAVKGAADSAEVDARMTAESDGVDALKVERGQRASAADSDAADAQNVGDSLREGAMRSDDADAGRVESNERDGSEEEKSATPGTIRETLTILATGPEQKNTFTLLRDDEAFVSQHIGDMENADTYEAWIATKDRFESLFDVKPRVIACDMHPEYLTSKWAHEQVENSRTIYRTNAIGATGAPEYTEKVLSAAAHREEEPSPLHSNGAVPSETSGDEQAPLLIEVQHHHAHVVAAMAENNLEQAVCGIAFDGTGYGMDGSIWGGEVLLSNLAAFERFANFAYVPMPSGAGAIKHPLRMAYGVLWAYDLLEHPAAAGVIEALGDEAHVCEHLIETSVNTPMTSSVGRLFDAASALLGVCTEPTYEGEGAVLLEAAISPVSRETNSSGSKVDEIPFNAESVSRETCEPENADGISDFNCREENCAKNVSRETFAKENTEIDVGNSCGSRNSAQNVSRETFANNVSVFESVHVSDIATISPDELKKNEKLVDTNNVSRETSPARGDARETEGNSQIEGNLERTKAVVLGAEVLGAEVAGVEVADAEKSGAEENEEEAAERYAITIVKNTATPNSTAQDTSVVLLDAENTFRALLDDLAAGVSRSVISRRFHDAFVGAIVDVAELVRAIYDINVVVLSGGVFMNRYLVEHVLPRLEERGFTVALNRELPPNDGCMSFGQAIVARAQLNEYMNVAI